MESQAPKASLVPLRLLCVDVCVKRSSCLHCVIMVVASVKMCLYPAVFTASLVLPRNFYTFVSYCVMRYLFCAYIRWYGEWLSTYTHAWDGTLRVMWVSTCLLLPFCMLLGRLLLDCEWCNSSGIVWDDVWGCLCELHVLVVLIVWDSACAGCARGSCGLTSRGVSERRVPLCLFSWGNSLYSI